MQEMASGNSVSKWFRRFLRILLFAVANKHRALLFLHKARQALTDMVTVRAWGEPTQYKYVEKGYISGYIKLHYQTPLQ